VKSQGIADHGIIEAIEMHQFMCHKFLTFSFGPQINFIIGAHPNHLHEFAYLPTWIQGTMGVCCTTSLSHAAHLLFLSSGGKSAVLSAITVALGGKANSTGRGNGLKSFIREGQAYVFHAVEMFFFSFRRRLERQKSQFR